MRMGSGPYQTSVGTVPLPVPPAQPGASTATTGGTLVPGTYAYAVAGITGDGRNTGISPAVAITVPAGTNTNTVTLTFAVPTGCFGCAVYRSINGGPLLLVAGSPLISTSPYTDTGFPVSQQQDLPPEGGSDVGMAAHPFAIQMASTARPPEAQPLAGAGRGQVNVT